MRLLERSALTLLVLASWVRAAPAQVGLATYTGHGGIEGYIAVLDISSGAFTPAVSALDPTCRRPGNGQVMLTPTSVFAGSHHTLLAVTANTGALVTGCGTPAGLLVSNGQLANPGQTAGPVLYFVSPTQAAVTDQAVPGASVR